MNKMLKTMIATPIILILMGASCQTKEVIKYVDRPYEVKVPVVIPIPEPPTINNPFLPLWLLRPENIQDPDIIAKYYVKSVYLLESQVDKLQCALDAYRTETPKMCPITVEEME